MTTDTTITGDVRPGAEFQFTGPPRRLASSTFTALVDGKLIVTRRATEKGVNLEPGETPPRPDSYLFKILNSEAQAIAKRWWETGQ